MKEPFVVAFCSPADRVRIIEAVDAERVRCGGTDRWLAWPESEGLESLRDAGRLLILLAIGGEGGAALATWMEEAHGLDEVRGIGLVGVTAPWAQHEECRCEGLAQFRPCTHADRLLSLGPVERLRKTVEKALAPKTCDNWSQEEFVTGTAERGTCSSIAEFMRAGPDRPFCAKHAKRWNPDWLRPLSQFRLVIACSPDDGVCDVCKGGGRQGSEWGSEGSCDCPACFGTGKVLSSREVAVELVGSLPGPWTGNPATFGGTDGVRALLYPSSAVLASRGVAAVIAELVPTC